MRSQDLGFRVGPSLGLGFRLSGLGLRILVLGFGVWGVGKGVVGTRRLCLLLGFLRAGGGTQKLRLANGPL